MLGFILLLGALSCRFFIWGEPQERTFRKLSGNKGVRASATQPTVKRFAIFNDRFLWQYLKTFGFRQHQDIRQQVRG
jgi:hypothetical protein